MRRTLALLLACILGLGLLPGCTTASAAQELTAPKLSVNPAESEAVNEALASFGLELLQATRTAGWEQALKSSEVRPVSKDEAGPAPFSTLISPLSVALALSMAANGAEGDTLDQFLEVLGGGTDLNELNAACAQLARDYQALEKTGSTRCSIANSLWADPQGQISQDFISRCLGAFDAQLFQAELSGAGIVKDLNRWVSKHTNQMIPNMIDRPFPENTALLLVNALYLKNKWLWEFSPNATHKGDFHHENGSDSRMDFLSKHNTDLSYLSGEGAQGVVLPYDDGRLAFVAILPDLYPDSPDFGQWLSDLEGEDLSRLINTREDTPFLSFAMPKFTAEWRGDLTKILPELGLEDPFDVNKANFSGMGDLPEGYFISQVIHAAKIEVNEKGTEAAAATVVAAAGGAAPPQDGVTLILDRPFLYGIVDLQTGVPLFLGTWE